MCREYDANLVIEALGGPQSRPHVDIHAIHHIRHTSPVPDLRQRRAPVRAARARKLSLLPVARPARVALLMALSCDLTKVPEVECDRTKA